MSWRAHIDGGARQLRKLFAKQNGICYLCGKPMRLNAHGGSKDGAVASIDHVIPRSRISEVLDYRQMDITTYYEILAGINQKAAHKKCNERKGNLLLDEYRARHGDKSAGTFAGPLPSSKLTLVIPSLIDGCADANR